MKVMVVTNDFPPIKGGIASVSVSVLRALLADGHDAVCLVPTCSRDSAHREGVRAFGYQGYDRTMTRLPSVWCHVLWRLLTERPDAVIGMNVSYSGPVLAILPSRHRPRSVLAAFGYEFLKMPRIRAFQSMIRTVYGRADAIFTVSDHMKARLADKGIDPHRILKCHICPPPLPPAPGDRMVRLRQEHGEGDPLVLTVARLVRRKGVDGVLRALAPVASVYPGVRYWIVGDGPEKGALMRLAEDLGLRDRVRFLGELDDVGVSACYGLADLFVLTPRSDEAKGDVEGLGLSFLEASLAGLPCVGTRSGGVPEAVQHGVSGLLVAEGDIPGLQEALTTLAMQPELRRELGLAGQAWVQREFSWDRMRGDLDRLLGGIHAAQ